LAYAARIGFSIPQTRSLTNQRAYRARKVRSVSVYQVALPTRVVTRSVFLFLIKAQYIAELERRCATVEEENRRLRDEIATARTEGAQQAFAAETVSTCQYPSGKIGILGKLTICK
jgi:hypothetical protein